MAIKLALLQSGEFIIANFVDKFDTYILEKPKRVTHSIPMFLSDDQIDQSSVEVTLTSWILLSKENKISIPKTWVVAIVEPVDSLLEMYERDLNGITN